MYNIVGGRYIHFEGSVMKMLRFLLSVSIAASCLGMSAPRPAVVQSPQQWTLDVGHEQLGQITMKSQQGEQLKRFWYLILTVTNNTADEVDFYPVCELMTDTFQIIPAGVSVPPQVIESIKTRHRGRYPFLEGLDASGMRILQGKDNTRDIMIVWPDFDAGARQVSLFISGLSNETVAVDNPAAKDNKDKPDKIFLRKTLMLDYRFSGDPAFRSEAPMTFAGESWIMR